MISDQIIQSKLTDVLDETSYDGVGELIRGKVRDSYKRETDRVIVVSDRVSCFDRIIGTVPLKGQVLNQIAAFWFDKTSDIAPNHVMDVPDPNVMVVTECEQLALEFVVRGYITGVTKTSAWYNYERGVRDFCGNDLPEGLQKNQILSEAILTPTTKFEKHDRPISRDEAIAEGLIDAASFDKAADICFKLFARGQEHASSRGLILVDTKYELGIKDGEMVVSDEIHTPDSSRYWFSDTYEERFSKGEEQKQIDKEFVRQWLADRGFLGDGEPPALTDEVRMEAARRYINAYEIITGCDFVVNEVPIKERVAAAMEALK